MAAKLCNVCNIRRPKTGSKGTETSPHNDMCNYCFEEGGQENMHSDGNHAGIQAKVDAANGFTTELSDFEAGEYADHMQECWICHPEFNLAHKAAKPSVASKNAGYVRRPQFNHKGHSHPQTPAARRACKAAFWASLTPVANVSTNPQVAEAMAKWDHQCDGFGKPVAPAKKGGWAGVAPLGPKGGVKASVKTAQAHVTVKSSAKRLGQVERGYAKASGLIK